MPDTAEEIAGRLTEAQRGDVLNGSCILGGDICLCGSDHKQALADLGLIFIPQDVDYGVLLTKLGLAVRTILQSKGSNHHVG